MATTVKYYYGATLIGEGTVAPNYPFSWTNAPAGNHAITAKVFVDGVEMDVSPAINVTGQAANTYLLDNYAAYSAWSLDKLKSTYAGPAIQVRKSGQSLIQDIGFNGDALDTAALLAYVGASDGFVSKIYDQEGSGLDFIQPTENNQPKIVSGGALITKNGKPAIDFSGKLMYVNASTASFNFIHNGTKSAIATVSHFGKVADPNSFMGLLGNNGTSSASTGFAIYFDDRVSVPRSNALTVSVTKSSSGNYVIKNDAENVITPNTQLLMFNEFDTTNATLASRQKTYINDGVLIANSGESQAAVTTNASYTLQLGAAGNSVGALTGFVQEIVMWNTDQSANRAAIQTNINNRYSIYP